MSLSVKTSRVRSRTRVWWRILSPDHARRSHFGLSETKVYHRCAKHREREKRSDEQMWVDVFLRRFILSVRRFTVGL